MHDDVKLYDLVDPGRNDSLPAELALLMGEVAPSLCIDPLIQALHDVESLFEGAYPGYKASNTKYHDIEHTRSVLLAQARLIHGGHVFGIQLTPEEVLTGLYAALFHDVGLIQTKDDESGTGAKYTVGHEERSIEFMHKYVCTASQLSDHIIDLASDAIRCTKLSVDPRDIFFPTPGFKFIADSLGTADLLAQMADRLYLEKLVLLFEEFDEAGLPGFESALDLMVKTKDFYTNVARNRIDNQLGGVNVLMRDHFRKRWELDRDLYDEAVVNNILYLETILTECGGELTCALTQLRRGGISQQYLEE